MSCFGLTQATTVYVHRAPIDFRKNINGLSALVENSLQMNLFFDCCFVFRNKRADKIKVLFWQKNGFWLCQKRLEHDRFIWPKDDVAIVTLSLQQLQWLLDGIDLRAMKGHEARHYSRAS